MTPGGGAATARTLIVALGTSSMAGEGIGPDGTYPAQLEAMLNARGGDVRVVDAGIDGDTSAGLLARFDGAVPARTRIVVPQTATDDAGREGHDENIAAIVDRPRARSIAVVSFRNAPMRELRGDHAQADGHHLAAEGYRIPAGRLLPSVERAGRG